MHAVCKNMQCVCNSTAGRSHSSANVLVTQDRKVACRLLPKHAFSSGRAGRLFGMQRWAGTQGWWLRG